MNDWDESIAHERETAEATKDDPALLELRIAQSVEDLQVREEAGRRWEALKVRRFRQALESADENAPTFGTTSAADLRHRPVHADLVEGLVGPLGSLNMASGYRGSMKSLSGLSVAGAVATGLDSLWGLSVSDHGPVTVVYRESPENLPRRLNAWEDHYARRLEGVSFMTEPIDMRDPDDVRRLAVLIKRSGTVLTVFDPVARTGGGKEDAEDFGAYRLGLEMLRDYTGVASLVLHNTGHAERGRGRGHSTLEDAMDSCVAFLPQPAKLGGGVQLEDTKGRDAAPFDKFRLKFKPCGPLNPAKGLPWSGVPVLQSTEETVSNALGALSQEGRDLLAALGRADPEGLTAAEVAELLKVDRTNVARSMKAYRDGGLVTTNGESTNKLRYLLSEEGRRLSSTA